MEPIYFHAKRANVRFFSLVAIATNENEDADLREEAYDMISRWPKTHTFCFHNEKDTLRVTWAKVFTGDFDNIHADIFSKKTGKSVSLTKMMRLVEHPPRTSVEKGNIRIRPFLFKYLPACVADTFPWYLDRALQYYKVDYNKEIIIEGSSLKENSSTYPEQRTRVAVVCYSNDIKDIL